MANSENLDLKRLDEPKSSTNFNHQIYYQNNFDKIDAAVGAKPADLTTTTKTIIPAINEVNAQLNDMTQDFSAQLAEKANKVQEAWITPTMLNGNTHDVTRPFQYRKNDFGTVECKGRINVTNGGNGVFQFPSSMRPNGSMNYPLVKTDGSLVNCVISTGIIYIANGVIDFSSLRFAGGVL